MRRPNATPLTRGRGYQPHPINSNPYVAGQNSFSRPSKEPSFTASAKAIKKMLGGVPRFIARRQREGRGEAPAGGRREASSALTAGAFAPRACGALKTLECHFKAWSGPHWPGPPWPRPMTSAAAAGPGRGRACDDAAADAKRSGTVAGRQEVGRHEARGTRQGATGKGHKRRRWVRHVVRR